MTWLEAHRLANLAAAQAHGDLGIDRAAPPVDVYRAIGDAGVVLMWRPMPRQFGAYIAEPGSRPGILINNGLPFAAQRQTAAHELGHHRLRHGTRLDADLDAPAARRGLWTPEEKAAEAFGAWFLMPRKAVMAGLAVLGLDRPRAPEDVYRLSLLLGTPYLATVRHLPNLRLASQPVVAAWARTSPAAIKAALDPATKPESRRADVWLIGTGFAGVNLTVRPGDRLVIPSAGHSEPVHDCPSWLRLLPAASRSARRSRPETGPAPAVLEVPATAIGMTGRVAVANLADTGREQPLEFSVKVEGRPNGIARRWIS